MTASATTGSAAPIAAVASGAGGSVLYAGEQLMPGESLVNGYHSLVLQSDGNLVLKYRGVPLWSTMTNNSPSPVTRFAQQYDGNLVMYRANGSPAWYKTGSGGGVTRFSLEPNGDLVLRGYQNYEHWRSGTGHLVMSTWPKVDDKHLDVCFDPNVPASVRTGLSFMLSSLFPGTAFPTIDYSTSLVACTASTDIRVVYQPLSVFGRLGCATTPAPAPGGACNQFRMIISSTIAHTNYPALTCHELAHAFQIGDNPPSYKSR